MSKNARMLLTELQASLEKQVKELNLRIVDLETRSYASPGRLSHGGSPRKVDSKIERLSAQLQGSSTNKSDAGGESSFLGGGPR